MFPNKPWTAGEAEDEELASGPFVAKRPNQIAGLRGTRCFSSQSETWQEAVYFHPAREEKGAGADPGAVLKQTGLVCL